jgi:hypothetical protein
MQDLQTLLNSNDLGFQTVGVSPDSVSRFLNILNQQNAPFNVAEYSSQRIRDAGSFLGSFDFVPQNSTRGNTYTATISANMNRTSPVGGGQTLLRRERVRVDRSGQLRHAVRLRGVQRRCLVNPSSATRCAESARTSWCSTPRGQLSIWHRERHAGREQIVYNRHRSDGTRKLPNSSHVAYNSNEIAADTRTPRRRVASDGCGVLGDMRPTNDAGAACVWTAT